MRWYILVFAAGLAACGRPPEAPKELDALSRYLYAEWDAEDPEVVAVGLRNLRAFLADVDLEADGVMDRSWELTAIDAATIAEVDHPDRDPSATLGLSVARASPWPPPDHARLQTEPDQTITEPSAESYARTFPDGDPACFPTRDCDVMVTDNQVARNNLVMTVEGQLLKDFRWIEIEPDRFAFISRSWIPEPWIGDAEKSKVWQSFSIDVWLPEKGGSWRYQTLWSESEVAGASDAIILGTVKSSTDQIFKAGDEAIETLYH